MTNRLVIFEDSQYANFYPLTLNRPIYELRCGARRLWEKISARFEGYEITFACREDLAGLYHQETGKPVNRIDYNAGDRLVFVNGRLRLGEKLAGELRNSTRNQIFYQGNLTAALVITEPLTGNPPDPVRFTGEGAADAIGIKADIVAGEFEYYEYLWNLIDLNANEIKADFVEYLKGVNFSRMIKEAHIDSSARILSDENLYLAPGAIIEANSVIDNRHGPVIIDSEAIIGSLSYIQGPCYIGPGTQIFRGNIREGCSFGPVCRVGGEVEESIFQGYTNKYHDGFMGHAYLGSWVNLGAMTTNSDLKNTYQSIKVALNGRQVDTGSVKVGSFIGDHSKTGIGTLLNTGISIGFSSNIYGGTLVTSREVPSFSWGDEKGYDIYRLDKAIEVARVAMNRRGKELTAVEEQVFKNIYSRATAGR